MRRRGNASGDAEQELFIRARKALEDRPAWQDGVLSIGDDDVLTVQLDTGGALQLVSPLIDDLRELVRTSLGRRGAVHVSTKHQALILPLGSDEEGQGLEGVTVFEIEGGGVAAVVTHDGQGARFAVFGVETLG